MHASYEPVKRKIDAKNNEWLHDRRAAIETR